MTILIRFEIKIEFSKFRISAITPRSLQDYHLKHCTLNCAPRRLITIVFDEDSARSKLLIN